MARGRPSLCTIARWANLKAPIARGEAAAATVAISFRGTAIAILFLASLADGRSLSAYSVRSVATPRRRMPPPDFAADPAPGRILPMGTAAITDWEEAVRAVGS